MPGNENESNERPHAAASEDRAVQALREGAPEEVRVVDPEEDLLVSRQSCSLSADK